MNKRIRKKQLKKLNTYADPNDLWDLFITLSNYIIPRLKTFRNMTFSYPQDETIKSFEDWLNALDQMILAFQYTAEENDWWINNPEYNYSKYIDQKTFQLNEAGNEIKEKQQIESLRRQEIIDNGLQLFSRYFQHLWI